jgi:hypothetical protein
MFNDAYNFDLILFESGNVSGSFEWSLWILMGLYDVLSNSAIDLNLALIINITVLS